MMEERTEESLKLLSQRLSKEKKKMCILGNKEGKITTNKEELFKILEKFYKEIYTTKQNKLSPIRFLIQKSISVMKKKIP